MYLLTLSTATDPESHAILVKHSNKMTAADAEGVVWRVDRPERKRRRVLGKVEKVESVGVMRTYDVEIENDPWFYAGAVKSHNTTSKLFGLTEGWHLPSMREFLRWVQFRSDDPLIEQYRDQGYPTKELVTYSGTTIVGFPTAPVITTLGMGDKMVLAGEATPDEHFKWLRLGEKYWIDGTDEKGVPVKEKYGAQASYTLRLDPRVVSLESFKDTMLRQQQTVKCCSVMPMSATTSYEYLPEEPISHREYERLVRHIKGVRDEDISKEHIQCDNGVCPIDFKEAAD
jgi:hypothetical protein